MSDRAANGRRVGWALVAITLVMIIAGALPHAIDLKEYRQLDWLRQDLIGVIQLLFFPNSLDYLLYVVSHPTYVHVAGQCLLLPLSYLVGIYLVRLCTRFGRIKVVAGYFLMSAAIDFVMISVFWRLLVPLGT